MAAERDRDAVSEAATEQMRDDNGERSSKVSCRNQNVCKTSAIFEIEPRANNIDGGADEKKQNKKSKVC